MGAVTAESDAMLGKGNRLFVDGLRKMDPDKVYYPNANSTMRTTYGTVGDYVPADAVHYDYVTTLDGVIEKYVPGDHEFDLPQGLIDLYDTKDYGQYADKNGDLIINFIHNTDITGGNSGSPVINAKGHLIGTAFDGNWEAMSGDIAFEDQLQRTISVDARYILFIIDKFAGASNIIDELTLVGSSKNNGLNNPQSYKNKLSKEHKDFSFIKSFTDAFNQAKKEGLELFMWKDMLYAVED